jgi:hypothetical protein
MGLEQLPLLLGQVMTIMHIDTLGDPSPHHCRTRPSSSVETVVALLTALWDQRRADPLLLVQPGAQWPKVLEEPLLDFPGYGDRIRLALQGGQIRVAPDTGKRMRASGIFSPEL